jgi:NAD(P)H-dependent FMN reductase
MSATSPLKLQVIIGSTRQNRFGEKPAQWIFEEAKKRAGIQAELVDLRDYPLPFFDEPIPPGAMKGNYPNPEVSRWAKKVAEADGYIIVTPEYNHGYPAVLKNALDNIYGEWSRKPVGFVSYGSVSGARSVEQLRQVVIELEMAPIRNAVHVPPDMFRAVKAGTPDPFEPLKGSAEKFFDQLLWWGRALRAAREESAR